MSSFLPNFKFSLEISNVFNKKKYIYCFSSCGPEPLPYEWFFSIKKKRDTFPGGFPVNQPFFPYWLSLPLTVSAFICLPFTPPDLFLPALTWFTEALLCTSGMFIEQGSASGTSGQTCVFSFLSKSVKRRHGSHPETWVSRLSEGQWPLRRVGVKRRSSSSSRGPSVELQEVPVHTPVTLAVIRWCVGIHLHPAYIRTFSGPFYFNALPFQRII